MEEKFTITVTPHWLFVIGRSIGELKNELAQSIVRYESVTIPLFLLSILDETESVESIAKEADSWNKDLIEKYSSQEHACLDSKDHESLKLTVVRWDERLSEISKNWLIWYPDTHLDTSKLRDGVKAFLSHDEFNSLETLEQQSLREAVSSLLFSNFISAEFMALRTAESLLKKWYEKKTGKKLMRTTWGQVLDKLNEEFPNERDRPKDLLLLDYLRERRNEIAHPEAMPNSVLASTTFLNVVLICKSLHLKKD